MGTKKLTPESFSRPWRAGCVLFEDEYCIRSIGLHTAIFFAVSIGMKFYQAREVSVTRRIKRMWDYVASFNSYVRFDKKTIKELKRSLQLISFLELTQDLAFSSESFSHLIASESFVRPFSELKYKCFYAFLVSMLLFYIGTVW